MILLIDNYDSFVYNLARYVSELQFDCVVKRNDKITLSDIVNMRPSHIIISPGPCTPNEAGISMDVIRAFGKETPILGVCLGHQAIGQVYGGKITQAKNPSHGKSSFITHDQKSLFQHIENPLRVGRYHSLIVSEENFPDVLRVTARCDAGEIMALKHNSYPIYGVQFHPESVLTRFGHELLKNFLLTKTTVPQRVRDKSETV